MPEIYPPFTERYCFTGPNVAISCSVEWDSENEEYHAKSDNGFHGWSSHNEEQAALMCFLAWMTGIGGAFIKETAAV